MNFYPKFHFKTLLYAVIPGGIGHHRRLRRHRNPNYDHERDKHPVREKHNAKKGWSHNKFEQQVNNRQYDNYEQYRTHQAQKFHEIIKMYGGFSNRTIFTWRRRFWRRFRHFSKLLPKNAVILCLGARQGTEVEVLRDMGFTRAYGIDLNPGPNNPYVTKGDFMKLNEPNNSIDVIYTNSVDHAFNLTDFLSENRRVLRPEGYALYDLPRYSGTRSAGAFEAISWDSENEIFKLLSNSYRHLIRGSKEKKWQWVLFQGPKKM